MVSGAKFENSTKLVQNQFIPYTYFFGSGVLPGKMLLVRIIENNKIDAYFRSG